MAQEEHPGITIAQAAQLLNLSAIRIKQLIRAGVLKRDDKGRLTTVSVVHGYLDFKEAELERIRAKGGDNELRRAKAKEIELRTAKAERELVAREDVEALIHFTVEGIKERLPSLPGKFTRDARERRRLGDLVETVLAEISGISAKHLQTLRLGLDAPEVHSVVNPASGYRR